MIKLGTNILSQTVQRNLGRVSQDLSRASERLSSGQRINRASDDAAGLAISMSLDKDQRLARTAQRNVSDGISMVSIMSAGLKSQKEILFRMAELAEQSANGTYSTKQREVLQKEYGSLMDEFDRIADASEFNGVKLLRNATPQTIQFMAGITGADSSLLQVVAANSHRYAGVLAQRSAWNDDIFVDGTDVLIEGYYVNTYATGNALPGFYNESRFVDPAIVDIKAADGTNVRLAIQLSRTNGSPSGFGIGPLDPPLGRYLLVSGKNLSTGEVSGQNTVYDSSQNSVNISLTFGATSAQLSIDISGLTYQSRDQIGVYPGATVPDAVTRQSAVGFTNVTRQAAATRALETITNRIDDLSALEGQYGAVESRLNVAHNLLSTSGENFAAAASRIKDADIASEAANSVRSGILQQAATSLLAQANQAPRIALSLLSGI